MIPTQRRGVKWKIVFISTDEGRGEERESSNNDPLASHILFGHFLHSKAKLILKLIWACCFMHSCFCLFVVITQYHRFVWCVWTWDQIPRWCWYSLIFRSNCCGYLCHKNLIKILPIILRYVRLKLHTLYLRRIAILNLLQINLKLSRLID